MGSNATSENGCSVLFVKSVNSFLFTTILYFLVAIISSNKVNSESVVWGLILAPMYGFSNSVFMFFASLIGLDRVRIKSIVYILVESVLFITILGLVVELIAMLPESIRMYHSKFSSGIRSYFSGNYIFIYTFIILAFILWLLKKLFPVNNKAAVDEKAS